MTEANPGETPIVLQIEVSPAMYAEISRIAARLRRTPEGVARRILRNSIRRGQRPAVSDRAI